MISVGSCDIEDWSNDPEISALHDRNKLYHKYLIIINNIFLLYFKYSLCEQKSFLFKTITDLKRLNCSALLNYCIGKKSQ